MIALDKLVRVRGPNLLAVVDAVQAGCIRVVFADTTTGLYHPSDLVRVRARSEQGAFYSERQRFLTAARLKAANARRSLNFLQMRVQTATRLTQLRELYSKVPLCLGVSAIGSFNQIISYRPARKKLQSRRLSRHRRNELGTSLRI